MSRLLLESWAARKARRLADAALEAHSVARDTRDAQKCARTVVNETFDSFLLEHCGHHHAVASARKDLMDARRRAGFIRGRRAVRLAKRGFAAAKTKLMGRQIALRTVSVELARSLDGFAAAVTHTATCDLASRDAQDQADDADRSLSPRDRLFSLVQRQRGRCGICGKSLLVFLAKELHVDHVRPRIRGGTDDPSNLQATHAICNVKKGTTWPWPPADFDPRDYFNKEILEAPAHRTETED